jgi:DNA-binding GntR family transcriptional regulator
MPRLSENIKSFLPNFSFADPSEAASKSEYAYLFIRDRIISNTYEPGTVLYIREISEKLNISRTPVKEAISRLAYEGFVELFQDRYAVVSKIDYSDVVELLELRECVEGETAYYASLRHTEADLKEIREILTEHKTISFKETMLIADCDMRFHMAIACASYNRQMIRALQGIFEKFIRITLPIQKAETRILNSIMQHTAVVEAIANNKADEARRLMREHITDILHSVKIYQYQNIHLFK